MATANLPTRNNNPGDIRDPQTGAFRQYQTPEQGFLALASDLHAKMTGATTTGLKPTSTLQQFANVYAPASDGNDPIKYAAAIASRVGTTVNAPISSLDLHSFTQAVAHGEGYQGQIPQYTVDELAQKIKQKYPAYANVDNAMLVQKIIAKYPQYRALVIGQTSQQTAQTTTTQQPQTGGFLATIKNAAEGGIDKLKQGLADAYNGVNPVESALKIGAGAVDTATAPLAPLFSPLGKLIGYVSDKISNSPTVQSFAQSPTGNVASRLAEDIGNASEIAGAVVGSGKGSAPLENAVTKTADAAGSTVAQGLGATTGAGAESVRAAFRGSKAFTDAMRGKIAPDDVIQSAQDAVQNIAENRRTAYLSDLEKLGAQTTNLDISPVQQVLDEKLQSFGIKKDVNGNLDFSRSSIANNGSARSDVQGVYDTLKTWGTQKGDRTPVGLDTLKKQLADFYSPSGSARALVQAVKSKVSNVLETQVPGYKDMTGNYGRTTQLLDDIKSATSIGGRAKADTIFTKLTTALKADKEFRIEMLKELQSKGSQPDLIDQIAGLNMNSAIPKGLVGKGADIGAAFAVLGHYFDPHYIPMLLATSPRVVGEFLRVLGMPQQSIALIISTINKYAAKGITTGALAAPQSTRAQGQTR